MLDGRDRPVGPPQISFEGVLDSDREADLAEDAITALDAFVGRQPAKIRRDDEALAEAARVALRRHLFKAVGKKPVTRVHLVRIE